MCIKPECEYCPQHEKALDNEKFIKDGYELENIVYDGNGMRIICWLKSNDKNAGIELETEH